ncbi:MAG: endonuclease/exonuclease/phosphatase family protein, partial [Planctomycetaceae bacterium]|nr:endonuclease/exonuclease/phosphatase family protein [Planctomycetaceae bacterium]
GLAVTGLLFFVLKRTRSGLIFGLCAVACWTWWLQGSSAASLKETPPATVRVVFWNTARLKAGWSPVAEQIQAMSSPIMGFVEAGPDEPTDRIRWQHAFPKYQRVFFGNGMVLLVQGEVIRTEWGELGTSSYFGRADLVVAGREVTVFLVDINSNPFFCREEALKTLHARTKQASSGTVLVMGDFNTPSDSVHLQGLRNDFSNALEVAGQGTGETWPTPFPVLAIDQIWVNRKRVLSRAGQECSMYSDHRAVIAELALSE